MTFMKKLSHIISFYLKLIYECMTKLLYIIKDEKIVNYKYIGSLISWIYLIYQGYIWYIKDILTYILKYNTKRKN